VKKFKEKTVTVKAKEGNGRQKKAIEGKGRQQKVKEGKRR
jgi:hypothetical protein